MPGQDGRWRSGGGVGADSGKIRNVGLESCSQTETRTIENLARTEETYPIDNERTRSPVTHRVG